MVLLLLGHLALGSPADAPTEALARDIAAGAPVQRAVAVQVGQPAFDAMTEVLPGLLPVDAVQPGTIAQSQGIAALCLAYSYSVAGLLVDFEVVSTAITPSAAGLGIDADLIVSINAADDPFHLQLDAICLVDEDCVGWIEPFPLSVHVPVGLSVVGPPDARVLDASVGAVQLVHDLGLDDLLGDCDLESIDNVLGFFGLSLVDLVLDRFTDTIADEIEATLDELLAQAWIAQVLEVQGAEVALGVQPTSVTTSSGGMELVLAARLAGQPSACIDRFDPGVSTSTGGPTPAPDPGTPIAIHAAQDLLNQAAYAFWRAGLLCQEIGEGDLELPGLPFDTTLLGLLGGDPFKAIFPEPAPLVLATFPHEPPVVSVDGPHDLDVAIRDLELVFMAELDGRMARGLGVSLDADVGVDLVFDEQTGELGVLVDLTADDLSVALAGPMLVKDIEDEVLATVTGVLGSLIGPLVGGLVGDDLAFALPTFDALGLTSLTVGPTGADADWIGLTGEVGLVDYGDPSGGCACDGDDDCGGCAAGGGRGSWWLAGLAVLVLRRRR